MTAKENISPLKRWGGVLAVNMTMRGIDIAEVKGKQGVIRHYGKIQHHLINLGVAVAANAKQPVLDRVEHGGDLLGRVFLGQLSSRSVIEQVAKQEQLLRTLALKALKHLAAVFRRAVDIRGNHKLHVVHRFLLIFARSAEGKPLILYTQNFISFLPRGQ